MMQRLAGKVAQVTGATFDIGAVTARRFAREGARVVLNTHVDVAAVHALVDRATSRFGAVDLLVNSAGRNFFHDPLTLTVEPELRLGRYGIMTRRNRSLSPVAGDVAGASGDDDRMPAVDCRTHLAHDVAA
jgi:hypothetical protein